MLKLQNLHTRISNLNNCDVNTFSGSSDNSFVHFIKKLKVNSFRHINDLEIEFKHPITVISGSNKVGKTSILLLLACSHEKFMKLHSTKPETQLIEHSWKDVIRFTKHESESRNYKYQMWWRTGHDSRDGTATRRAGSQAWSGLGKKSSKPRKNAKIKDKEVRLIDLERIAPVRSFSNSLFYKSNLRTPIQLNNDIEKAFSYIFGLTSVKLYEAGSHVNRKCYIIEENEKYSSYSAASGEEAVINILTDIINTPKNSLILIDELEAAFHPSIQRKLANIIQFISWEHKKQFIITTHSPTLMSSFNKASRRFIEKDNSGSLQVVERISKAAAFSKMDMHAHPLIHLYCEDTIAKFIVDKIMAQIINEYPAFNKLINIIPSGPVDQVKNDYERHKHNFTHMKRKVGFCAIFDGDYKEDSNYSHYHENSNEHTFFISPYKAPEKFFIEAYLEANNHAELRSDLAHEDHHTLFDSMCSRYGLASDKFDARNICFAEFKKTADYTDLEANLKQFLIDTIDHFSEEGE